MNFVRGFLRRSGSQQGSESRTSTSDSPPTWPDVHFSADGVEESLHRLWEAYQDAPNKKKRKLLDVFLDKFNQAFERWTPVEASEHNVEFSGCVFGHPTRLILGLVHELKVSSELIGDLHASSKEPSLEKAEMDSSLALLTALGIVTRASHNRMVFSSFGGIQALTGLMKNGVVSLKGISSDTPLNVVIFSFLERLLSQTVSIMTNFITLEQPDKPSTATGNAPETSARTRRSSRESRSSTLGERSGSGNFALLLETGGLNWFVELLRVLRKLRLRGVPTDDSLESLVLQALKAAIAASSRAQNHFRSIGGLEVLLDGVGRFPSSSTVTDERSWKKLVEDFNMQVLSLEVVREAVFRNVNSLQSVRELGGLQKFVELFRWAAFSFPGLFIRFSDVSSEDAPVNTTTSKKVSVKAPDHRLKEKDLLYLAVDEDSDDTRPWNSNVSRLCKVLCSFLVATGDIFSLNQDGPGVTSLYWDSATRLIVNVLLGVFKDVDDNDGLQQFRLFSTILQINILGIFKRMLLVSPLVLKLFQDEGVWTILFSKYFFYFGLEGKESTEAQPLQLEVISFAELAASTTGNSNNWVECNALVQALEQCTQLPCMATMLLKSLHRILQVCPDSTAASFKKLEVVLVLSEVMAMLLQTLRTGTNNETALLQCRDAAFLLFNECLSLSEDAKSVALRSTKLVDVLFNMVSDPQSRSFAIHHVTNLMKLAPSSEEDQDAKMELCMKYLETLSRVQSDKHSTRVVVILDLLSILRDVLQSDFSYYQALFREVECFVHIVSLLNESYPDEDGKRLCQEVIATLIHLLKGNEASKLAFRSLVGSGYKMLGALLIDQFGSPTESLLGALLDMLVDGKFEIPDRMTIQNEDAVILIFDIIRQCDHDTQLRGLDTFLVLLGESTANQTCCVKAGLLCLLLDWFSSEGDSLVLQKVTEFMKLVGGHSISGKEIRRIFSLLRDTMTSSKQKNSLLLSTFKSMFGEQGPSVFFELTGTDSGIAITTPLRWPTIKGFSFTCWLRIESLPGDIMGLYSFLTETGKGCAAFISGSKLTIEVECSNQKRQTMSSELRILPKKWHFICITHATGRALGTGNLCKVFIDGQVVGGDKLRYPKVYDPMTQCTVGASVPYPLAGVTDAQRNFSSPLRGQLGPVYLFEDVLSQGQVQALFMLGAGYMYSFLPSEVGCIPANMPDDSLFSLKDGLSSKMVFGYNALASSKRNLFDITPITEQSSEKPSHEATIMTGTQLCYRCLVQDNIHCVGGITVFFPLLTRLQQPLVHTDEGFAKVVSEADDFYLVDVIELLAAVTAKNYANQKFLHSTGGLNLLGFLLQFVSIKQLSVKVISALNTLLYTLADSNDSMLSGMLIKDVILKVYLNPSAWIFSPYVIQRELYLSLINFLENRKCESVCSLSRFLDMIHHFYWDKPKFRRTLKGMSVIGERPRQDDLSQLRILLLSLAEETVKRGLSLSDTKALLSFIDRSDDITCVDEVLQMLLGLLGEQSFTSSFLENIHVLGGLHIFLNLLKRQHESVRLLTLHIIGTLSLASSPERRSTRIFGIGSTVSKSTNDPAAAKHKDYMRLLVTERLLMFPFTEAVRITLFDILLGASIPKQVLQGSILTQFGRAPDKRSWIVNLQACGNPAHTSTFPQFFLPGVLGIILKFVESCDDWMTRQDVLKDILVMMEANPANCDIFVQVPGWQEWILSVLANALTKKDDDTTAKRWIGEVALLRKIFSMLHAYAVCNMKGGWRQFERTAAYVQIYADQDSSKNMLYDFVDDVLDDVLKSRSSQASVSSQPCRDNVLYLLSLVEELVVADCLPFLPLKKTEESEDNSLLSGSYVDLGSEESLPESAQERRNFWRIAYHKETTFPLRLYENVWSLLACINSNSQGGTPSAAAGPSFGQRARGLVESLNIPAAEVAAAVTGGLGSVGINVPSSKGIEKAMRLRVEKFSRTAFRLVLLSLHKGSLEAALSSVQQFLPLVSGFLTSDIDQNKGQLQLLLWCLLDARKLVGDMDDGARYHVVSQLIQELLDLGKGSLASTLADKEKRSEEINLNNDASSVYSLLQEEKVHAQVKDDKKFVSSCRRQWASTSDGLFSELKDASETECLESKVLEEQAQAIMNSVHNSELNRRAAYQLKMDAEEQAVASQWCLIFRNLTDERGPWSSTVFPSASTAVWWKVDRTEDPLRRRMKLKRNYHFDPRLLQPPEFLSQNSTSQTTVQPSGGKRIGLRTTLSFADKETEEDDEMQDASDEFDNENEPEASVPYSAEDDTSQGAAEDEVLLSVACVMISPKRKLAGRLEVTKLSLHFHMEFVIEGTGGSMVFDQAGGLASQESAERNKTDAEKSTSGRLNVMKQHHKWDLFQITAIYATRYLLQNTALEIFFANAAPPVFFNFQSQDIAKDVALKITVSRNFPGKGKPGKDKSQIHFVDRKKAIELAEKARDCWRRREYSNFEYLMILNTLACRSYNDLTQYPVFPWILSDYSSESLDLSNPAVYRDLSKPVGALDEKRFKVFEERYNNFMDPDIPSFYYGSHYSSMGIVLFYLLRLEPFSSLHRILQGGKFDHADRLFHSIQSAYANCLTNTSDVKETIPEFFYMPEFLVNTNNYFIGVKQDGQQLGDVVLPPWAKGSPEEFIRLNREALESEYASENLHHWIDLIFGYKQRGRPAVESANIFYYLTYEGAVELESMTDVRQRASVEDQIANFGQTPVQLFRKKHPRRGPLAPLLRPLYYSPGSITLTTTVSSRYLPSSPSQEDFPVLYIGHNDGKIICVTSDMIVSVRAWLTPGAQSAGSFTFSSPQDLSYGLGSDVWPSQRIRGYFSETFVPDASCFSALQLNSSSYLITCGHWDNSFKLMSLTDGHTAQSNCQHKDVVTCVSVATDGSVVATGSRDTTVMVWDVLGRRSQKQDVIISDKPRHVLCGHDDVVTTVIICSELDLVVSGSKDGSCILHTLRQGRYVRSLVHPNKRAISLLAVSQHGLVVLFSIEDLSLYLFSINGKRRAETELNGRLSCMEVSKCGEFLVCGGDNGHVTVRKMLSMELVYRYEGVGSPVTSLCVTPEDSFLVATRVGKILVYAVETRVSR